jgi:hypothetical protein
MKTKKPIPKNAILAGIPVVGLLVVVVGWMLVVSPQNKKATSLRDETAQVQQKITAQLAAAAAARTAVDAPKIRVADVYKLAKAMPSVTDMPNILLELSQLARDAGVDLQSISPGQQTPVNGQTTIPITLNVAGDFYTVTDMLYRLRNLVSVRHGALQANGRLYGIDTVSLAPSGKSITASILMHTYIYSAPVAAAPVTPAPSSTDTTATTTTPESTDGVSATGAP